MQYIRPIFFSSLLVSLTLMQLACATAERRAPKKPAAAAWDPSIPRPEVRLNVDDNQQTELASYRVLRQVSMFYKLDLQRNNTQTANVANVMRTSEEKIRQCYMTRLEAMPSLKGQMALSFVVSKKARSIKGVTQVGGTLTDRPLLLCIARELSLLPLSPSKSVRGRLVYSFDVVETVAQN